MLFIVEFNLWIFLLILKQASAVSYNQPTFCSNSSWNQNATTVANHTRIGSSPYDIFINTNNTIYVNNQDNGQIIIWSLGNITSIESIWSNGINSSSLFVTTTGDIYIDTFYSIGGISKITFNSTINIPRMNLCQQCWDLFIDINNILYCSLSERYQIIAKSLNNNSNSLTIVGGTGTAGSTINMLHSPRGIFVDINFDLYVSDCRNDRIQLFRSGKLSAITIAGNGSLNMTITLNCPTNIVLDGDKYLFIVDFGYYRIVGSNANGFRCLVGCSGSSGSASNQLYNPWSISFDSYGNIYVSDQGNNRIQKFSLMNNSCATLTTTICVTTRITTTITSTPLPPQCVNYTSNTDATRKASFIGSNGGCDNIVFNYTGRWYRFSGGAGTMLADCPVAVDSCGTCATGWYSGIYPSSAGGITNGTACFNFNSNSCTASTSISITNCNGFYVYQLGPPPYCFLRYCTI